MISDVEAISILDKFKELKPSKFFNKVDENLAGMRFVLLVLSENINNDVYASTLAEKMNISRARVGTIVQKLLSKGLIEKKLSCEDARIEVLKITPLGLNEVENGKKHIIDLIKKFVNEIGTQEIYKFLNTLQKFKHILEFID